MPSEVELDGSSDEHLITFAMCRDHGLRLVGPPAKEVFSPVQTSLVIQALRHVLSWHKNQILDPFHDLVFHFFRELLSPKPLLSSRVHDRDPHGLTEPKLLLQVVSIIVGWHQQRCFVLDTGGC